MLSSVCSDIDDRLHKNVRRTRKKGRKQVRLSFFENKNLGLTVHEFIASTNGHFAPNVYVPIPTFDDFSGFQKALQQITNCNP